MAYCSSSLGPGLWDQRHAIFRNGHTARTRARTHHRWARQRPLLALYARLVFFSMPASMRPLYNVAFGIQYSSLSQYRQRSCSSFRMASHTTPASATRPQVKPSQSYSSSPLKSSSNTALTSCFLLILPMALRGMWSTTRRTWGIL